MLRRPALWVAGGVLLAALICTSCTWAARNDAMSGSGARGGGPLASFATFFDWFAANAGVYVTISILILVLILGIGWAARRWEESLRPVIDVHFLDPSGAPGLTVKSVPLGGSPDLPSSVGRIGQQFSGRDEAGRLRQLDLPLNSEFGEFETVRVGGVLSGADGCVDTWRESRCGNRCAARLTRGGPSPASASSTRFRPICRGAAAPRSTSRIEAPPELGRSRCAG